MWLPDGEKVWLRLCISTESMNVTDGRTDPARRYRPRLCISRGKNQASLLTVAAGWRWCSSDGECTESLDVYDGKDDSEFDLRDDDVASLTICTRGSADAGNATDIVAGHHRRRPTSPGRHHFHHSSVGRRLTLVYRRLVAQLSNPDPAWIYFRFRRRRRRPATAAMRLTTAAVEIVTTTVHPVTSHANCFRSCFMSPPTYWIFTLLYTVVWMYTDVHPDILNWLLDWKQIVDVATMPSAEEANSGVKLLVSEVRYVMFVLRRVTAKVAAWYRFRWRQ